MKTFTRRAQIFSLISILMTVVFILFFSSMTHVAANSGTKYARVHIERMDEIVQDIDTIVEMVVDSSAYRIMNFSVDYVDTVDYFSDYKQSFEECFSVGRFDNGTHLVNCSYETPNVNNSLPAKLDELFALVGPLYNLTINYSHLRASFGQRDPYAVYVNYTILISIAGEDFSWRRYLNLSREISVIGVTDPLTIGTAYERPIKVRSSGGEFITAATFDQDLLLLQEFINDSYYYKDRTGISFIERFENHSVADIFENRSVLGITSFVPAHVNIGTPEFNTTSKIQHHYTSGYVFDEDKLRRFNTNPATGYPGFNSSLIIHRTYAETYLRVRQVDLYKVEGCCNEDGCYLACTP